MSPKIFKGLDLPENTEKIFQNLLEKGPSTARQLAERLDIPRPSIYDNIKILTGKGLVTERTTENKKLFCVDDINNIPELLQSKIETLQNEKRYLEKVLPTLIKKSSFIEPKIKFYTGKEGLHQVMNHIMWHSNIETILFWPMSEMLKVFGKEYLEELNKKRIKRNISIRGIWPEDKKVALKDYPFLGVGEGHLRDIRFAPKGMTWDMGYWMYEDRVIFLSSQKEAFGFVVHSRDFANLLKVQFDAIWKISTPAKPEPENTDKFLEDLH